MPEEGKSRRDLRSVKSKNKEEGEHQDGDNGYDLADIMAELKSQRRDIVNRLDGIDSRLENVTSEVTTMKSALSETNEALNKQFQRLDAAEQRISDLEDTLHTTKRDLHRAQKLIKNLEAKTDDLENRGRRKNLVLMGLPEQSEGQYLFKYIQQKIPEWLNLMLDQPLEIERAHRSLQPRPEPGKPPRPILIRFLRFRDREMIFQAAKKKTALCEGEAKLTFRQDLSAEVRRKRKEFSGVIEYFLARGMFRGFAYPHRLRVLHKGNIELFDNPSEAKALINKLERRLTETDSAESDH